jgi:uncharacterized FlgJ-related protein
MRPTPKEDDKTWTFIVDYEGGTYKSQFTALSILDAIQQYNCADPSGIGLVPISMFKNDLPVPVNGMVSVWATSGFAKENDNSFHVTIVKTER